MKRKVSSACRTLLALLAFAAALLAAGGSLRAQPGGGFSGFGDEYAGGFGGGPLGGGFVAADARFEPLVSLMVETITPDSWADSGGTGTIHAVAHLGVVVVRQTDEVHEQIEQLIAVLRQAQREQESGDGMTPAADTRDAKPALLLESKANSAARKKIEAALASPAALEFIETPLADVVEHIRHKHGIVIELDTHPLDGVGIGSDTPVTRTLSGISLGSALRLILRDLDLCYTIRDEVLLITTREETATMLTTRVYRLADLALPAQ